MALLAIESWVGVDIGIQVTGEDVLDLARTLDVLGSTVWQLDPIIEKVVSHPEDNFVDTLATRLS